MDVRAIFVVGKVAPESISGSENFAGLPLALCDVLGKSVLARAIQRLQRYGITNFVSICEKQAFSTLDPKTIKQCNLVAEDHGLWRSAENVFNDFVQKGAELVLVIRLGAYAEIDYEEFIQSHLEQNGHATIAIDNSGYRIGAVAVWASRRNDAAYLFRHGFEEFRVPSRTYVCRGYVNRLLNATDFRQLAVDALLQHNEIAPVGDEVRPGVWVSPSARVHSRARIVAPAFIGEHAKVCASAVITRFSTVEHHAVVDCGTVVENTSVAPFTYLGAGLDLNFAVIGSNRIANLRRDVEVEIKDPRLIATLSTSAPVRALRAMAGLATFVPKQFVRGLFASSQRSVPSDIPAAIKTPSPALKEPALPQGSMNSTPEFPSDFAVVRRYGNE